MKKAAWIFFCFVSFLLAETPVIVPNLDFEQQLAKWDNRNNMATVEKTAARTGEFGLRIHDESDRHGSDIFSSPFPVTPGVGYRLEFWAKKLNANSAGTSVYIRLFNKNDKQLTKEKTRGEIVVMMEDSIKWTKNALYFIAPRDAAFARIWIHSANAAITDDAIDDLQVFELTTEETKKIPRLSRTGFPPPAPKRIQEIYEMLSDKPQGLGYPVARRDKWDHLPNPNGADKIIKRAKQYMPQEPPELKDEEYLLYNKTGDRKTYERPYFQRKSRLFTFAVAEALENKGRFMPALEREINAILNEKSWVLPAHDSGLTNFNQTRFYADLFASERASDLATIDWWYQDRLKPEMRAAIRREIFRRTVDPYIKSIRTGDTFGHGWMFGNGNWTAVCTGNMVNCILTIVEDRMTRAEVLAATEYSDKTFLSGFTPDGYCNEGLGYWGYGFGHYLAMGEHILQATNGKMNIFEGYPNIENVAAFAKNIQIQDGIAPAFADCGVGARPAPAHLVIIQRHWPQSLSKQIKPDNVLDCGFPFMPLVAFSDESEYLKKLPEDAPYPIRSEFPDSGIYIFRHTDADGKVFGAAIKGGHNAEHHNHNDVGSFMVAWNNDRLIVDPGPEIYSRQSFGKERYTFSLLNSFGHCVPVVAGKLQRTGRAAKGVILKTDFTDEQDTVVMDMTSAYDVPELKSLIRTFVFNRPNNTITVTDTVEYTEPKEFSTALISRSNVKEYKPERHFIFGSFEACLDVNITASETFSAKTERLILQFDRLGPYRLSATLDKPVQKGSITWNIKATELPVNLFNFYKTPDVSQYKTVVDKAILVQAEDFTDENVPTDGTKVVADKKLGADGTALKLWDKDGHRLAWEVTIPQDGAYLLQLKACCAIVEGVNRIIKADGKDYGSFLFPYTGGWSTVQNDFKELFPSNNDGKPPVLNLKRGKHVIEMINEKGGGLNLDWFKLIPITK
ncbi:MAG: heparinase II/III family protein [Lentisphaeria bacterium]|nr:heparinase II/III family protein [Lentisphaeria bacterium]